MRLVFTFMMFWGCLMSSILFAQTTTVWTDVDKNDVAPSRSFNENFSLHDARYLQLDLPQLRGLLRDAPLEFSENARTAPMSLELPMPDGSFKTFEVVNSPIMEEGLAAKYPHVQTFAGTADDGSYLRFDYNDQNFTATTATPNGTAIITSFAQDLNDVYISYWLKDVYLTDDQHTHHKCEVGHTSSQDNLQHIDATLIENVGNQRNIGTWQLQTYRYAVTTTGEYYNFVGGGNDIAVLNNVVSTVGQLNMVYENDAAIRLILIDNTDELFFDDAALDPFQNGNLGQMINQNQTTIDGIIGAANYDLGHIYGTNSGGLANLSSVCIPGSKARAGSAPFGSSSGSNFFLTIAHEIGHQFSALHSFNNCDGDNESASTAYEPGAGSTIMSYSGASSCGSQWIDPPGYPYFHSANLDQIRNFSRNEATGGSCDVEIIIDNEMPEVTVDYENGFFIPISTPFELEASATDPDGDDDDLTYCWEQYDLGPMTPLGNPVLTSPLFRSYSPNNNPKRTFPNINRIVNNINSNEEVLPDYSRDMNFRCVVRDNNPAGGAHNITEAVAFKSTDTAGPFLVSYPNEEGVAIEAGSIQEITWDVANTDNNLVNCKHVNILMSTDGGFTYPITLACSTPNDGIEALSIPEIATTQARIRIEAADNIFFDISNNNFEVAAPTAAGFGLSACAQFQEVCVPGIGSVDLELRAFGGYESPVTFEIIDGLPMGANVTFSSNPATPGETVNIAFDFTDLDADGNYTVTLQAVGADSDTLLQELYFNVVYNDFTALEMLSPADGQTGLELGPEFTWVDLAQADFYDFEIATSPTFTEDVMVESVQNLTEATHTLSVGLEDNTLYFWRIRPKNECGASEYLVPNAFKTFTTSCLEFDDGGVTTGIGSGLGASATAFLNVTEPAIISDVNVTNLSGTYDAIPDLEISLRSPSGTEAILFSEICFTSTMFDIGLDDEAVFPAGTDCPPTNGVSYIPEEPLSVFDGEQIQGTWQINIDVVSNLGTGGFLSKWGLEFCASFEPNAPEIVNNFEKPVNILDDVRIRKEDLFAEDIDNEGWELDYTLVTVPNHGFLTFDGVQLNVGDQFHQENINWSDIRYFHTDGTQEIGDTDEFYFVVEDGTGGFVGTSKFTFVLTDDVLAVEEEIDLSASIRLFPNPANTNVNIAFGRPLEGTVTLMMTNLQGRQMIAQEIENAQGQLTIDTQDLSAGVYVLTIQTDREAISKKVVIQR